MRNYLEIYQCAITKLFSFKYGFCIIALLNYMSILFVVIAGTLAISAALPAALGHNGWVGNHTPYISYEDMEIGIHVDVTPYDLTVGGVDEVNLKIRLFDLLTDNALEQVTYRVDVWRAGDLLARNLFYDHDGVLYVRVLPDDDCDAAYPSECTNYGGSEHPNFPEALYVLGTECNDDNVDICARPTIAGPVFDKGGLYNIKVNIEGASGPKGQVAERLTYDTFVSIAQERDFLIRTGYTEEIPVVVKTYYDDVGNFAFDPSDSSITFDMPFDWSPEYVGMVPVVHEEIRIPSSFTPYSDGMQLKGYVNGFEIGQRALLYDPYSIEDTNIIHFLVSQSELERINAALGPDHHANKNMNFRLVPVHDVLKKFAEFHLVDTVNFAPIQTSIRLSWDGAYGASQTIPFEFAFFDSDGQLIPDVWYAYSVIDESDQVLFSSAVVDPYNPLIPAPEGIDIQSIHVPTEGTFRIDVHVAKTGLDLDANYSGIGSALVEMGPAQPATSQIPAWVKSNAALWTEGAIDDAVFVQAIQFLIQQGIIDIPPTESGDGSGGIPGWVRNNAMLWGEGTIDDVVFTHAIQFLIRQGIIVV